MGSNLPKQFLELEGKPLFCHSLLTFAAVFPDIHLILVMHPDHLGAAREALGRFCPFTTALVPGGATRFASVKLGLDLVEKDSIVFVHDGVRCLLSQNLIRNCYAVALTKGNAVPAVTATDSVRIMTATGNESVDRQGVRLVQTPQTFHSNLLKQAYALASGEGFTDDAAVAEHAGIRIQLVEGEAANIKITRPTDLAIAAAILQSRRSFSESPEPPGGKAAE